MRYLLFMFSFGIPMLLQAQSDCDTAIELCDDFYEEENASLNTGLVYEFTGTCNANLEQSSVWYTFTVQNDGFLSFTLDPNNDNDDYDWGLFEITDGGCAGIGTTSPEVSCNSWGVIGVNGSTGISTAQGGSGNSNGPGNLNGPPFNGDLPVLAGETYALVIMNWSNSLDGYSIDFGESTASLYDNIPPLPVTAQMSCDNENVILQFSEPILIESVQGLDFTIDGPGGLIPVTAATAETPGAEADDQIVIVLGDAIDVYGTYTITITDETGFVEDACGNLGQGSITVQVAEPLAAAYTTTTACNGSGGSFTIESITGGLAPYVVTFEGQVMSGTTEGDLDAGSYTAVVGDANGCTTDIELVIDDHLLELLIGDQDTLNCLNPVVEILNVSVEPEQEVTYTWSEISPDATLVSGTNTASPTVGDPGVYEVVVVHPGTGCSESGQVEIAAVEEFQGDLSSITFPNVFTPNDDSANEEWKPFLAADPELDVLPLFSVYELVIYNRWGYVVFESTSSKRAWKPSEEETEGTYFYHINYATNCGGGTKGVREGYIQLLR